MPTTRLEAFSDGVIAIIITIMVLELKVPHHPEFAALGELWPAFLSYILSFIYVGIHWNNHHHLFAACRKVNGSIMWANLHLLFWLSLIPFVTDWMGENHFSSTPLALYGFVLLMCATAYSILQSRIMASGDNGAALAREIGSDRKGIISMMLYVAGIALAAFVPWASALAYVFVALLWLVPDRRTERAAVEDSHGG